MTHLALPYGFDTGGRTGQTDDIARHVADLIAQTMLTNLGERVNRPDFGTNLPQMVFEPGSETLADATAFLIRAALQHWLQDVVMIEALDVAVADASLTVDLVYTVLATGDRRSQTIQRGA